MRRRGAGDRPGRPPGSVYSERVPTPDFVLELRRHVGTMPLPLVGVTAVIVPGDDVRALRFALVARGYKQSEVDWALEKLAREIDELRMVIVDLQGRDANDFSRADTDASRAEDV